jgi:hypothetical protein
MLIAAPFFPVSKLLAETAVDRPRLLLWNCGLGTVPQGGNLRRTRPTTITLGPFGAEGTGGGGRVIVVLGESPLSRATAPVVSWQGGTVIPNGEVRPGRRTPEVWMLEAP